MFIWWVIRRTEEFPNHVIIRRQRVFADANAYAPIAGLYDSEEDARGDIPKGLVRFRRHADDDPRVIESWL